MDHARVLPIASLLAVLLTTLHLADDIARGMSPGGLVNLAVVLVLVVWLYGTLALGGRRTGYAIVLVGSLLASGLPVVHMMNEGGIAGGAVAGSDGAFRFVWTIIALEATAILAAVLAALGLRRPRAG